MGIEDFHSRELTQSLNRELAAGSVRRGRWVVPIDSTGGGSEEVERYLAKVPEPARATLNKIRTLIRSAVPPEATEGISYGMPAFKLNGMLVFYAGYEKHIGFYPTPSGIESFKKELSVYKNAKGSVQFPLDKPLPITLINKIVKFRIAKNLESAKAKKK